MFHAKNGHLFHLSPLSFCRDLCRLSGAYILETPRAGSNRHHLMACFGTLGMLDVEEPVADPLATRGQGLFSRSSQALQETVCEGCVSK